MKQQSSDPIQQAEIRWLEERLAQLRSPGETSDRQDVPRAGSDDPGERFVGDRTGFPPLGWERFAEHTHGFAALFTPAGFVRSAHEDGLERIRSQPHKAIGDPGTLSCWLVDWPGRESAFGEALRNGVWTGNIPDQGSDGRNGRDLECSIIPVRANGELLFGVLADRSNVPACLRATVDGSETRFRALAEALPQLVWEAAPDGRVLYYNQRIRDYHGASRDSETGEWKWEPLVHLDDQAETMEAWKSALATGETYEIEHRIRMATGAFRWHLSRGIPIRDGNGAICRWFGTATDIHQSREAAEALARNEMRLRLAQRAGRIGIWEWTPDGETEEGTTWWSDVMWEIYGRDPDPTTHIEKLFRSAIHPDDVEDFTARSQEALRSDATMLSDEFRIIRPDGSVRWIRTQGSIHRGSDGSVLGMVGVNIDVTESKNAQEEIRCRAEQLANLAENTPDLLARFDRDFRYVFVNSAVARALGLPGSAILGRTKREVGIAPEMCDLWDNAMRRAVETGEIQRFEFSFGPPGDVRAYDSRVVPEWSEGGVQHLLAVIHDVTAQKRIEEELRNARDAAESASRARDKFLAVLSHELRTPLSPVLLTSSVLARDPSLPPATREAMAMIQRNVKVEARLIDDLLDLSRVLNGKLHLERQVLSLHGAIHHAVENCAEEAAAAGLEISEFFRAPVDLVSGDSARLQQVFWNLLKNAIKFTSVGGRVEIETTCAGGDFVAVVRDTGIGIPEQAISRLFQAFEQAGEHIGQRFGGLGLGLAICKGIIDLHGGSISAASDGVGKGAAFTVRLPLQAATAADLQKSPDVESATRRALLRVLLVEDHVDTAEAVARLLRSSGAEVKVAHTAGDALEAVRESPYDLLISDLGLPDLRGTELIRRLHAVQPMPGIAMSGYGAEEDLEATRRAGFAEHLVKPIDARELENAIHRVTRSPRDH